jgi:hypothetical protein
MAYTIGADGKLTWVDETPNRLAPKDVPAVAPGNGKPVFLRNLETGDIYQVEANGAQAAIDGGRFAPASLEEVHAYDERLAAENASDLETAGAFAGATVAAGFDAITGLPRLATAGAHAAGIIDEDPFADVAGAKLLPSSYKRAAEHSPIAVALGNVVGGVAGGGVLGKAASALGAGAEAVSGSRALGTATAGALEGSAFGLTGAQNEAYIKNEKLTSEQLVASMGIGALIGGGIGLGVGGAKAALEGIPKRGAAHVEAPTSVAAKPEPPARTVFPKVEGFEARGAANETGRVSPYDFGDSGLSPGGAANDAGDDVVRSLKGFSGASPANDVAAQGGRAKAFLNEFSEERAAKAIGASKADIKKMGGAAEARKMGREVLEYRMEDGSKLFPDELKGAAKLSQDDLTQRLATAREEVGSKLGEFRRRVNDFVETEAEDLKPNAREIAARIRKEVVEPLETSGVPDLVRRARPLNAQLEQIAERGGSLEELQSLRHNIAKVVYPKTRPGMGMPPPPPMHALELQQVERALEGEIEAVTMKAADRMGAGDLDIYRKLKSQYSAFSDAFKIAEAKTADMGNRFFSPTDYLTGAAGFAGSILSGNPVPALMAGAVAGAHKVVREHGSAVLATLANKLAKNVDDEIGSKIDDFLRRSVAMSGKPRGESVGKAVKSDTIAHALEGEAAELFEQTSVRRAFALEGGFQTNAHANEKQVRLPTATALTLFQGKAKDLQQAYKDRSEEIRASTQAFGAPIRANAAVALGGLAETQPTLAANMVTTATIGAAFLESKLPSGTVNLKSFTPNSAPVTVSSQEISQFARYWSAVHHPLSVLDDLRRGTATSEQVEALKAVYPALYTQIRQQVMTSLMEADSRGVLIPYQARLQLDLLLDLDGAGEPTATADFMSRFQAISQSNPEGSDEARPKPPARPVNIANRLNPGSAQQGM